MYISLDSTVFMHKKCTQKGKKVERGEIMMKVIQKIIGMEDMQNKCGTVLYKIMSKIDFVCVCVGSGGVAFINLDRPFSLPHISKHSTRKRINGVHLARSHQSKKQTKNMICNIQTHTQLKR